MIDKVVNPIAKDSIVHIEISSQNLLYAVSPDRYKTWKYDYAKRCLLLQKLFHFDKLSLERLQVCIDECLLRHVNVVSVKTLSWMQKMFANNN